MIIPEKTSSNINNLEHRRLKSAPPSVKEGHENSPRRYLSLLLAGPRNYPNPGLNAIVITTGTGIVSAALLVLLYFFIQPAGNYVIGYVNPNPTEFEGALGFLRNIPAYDYKEGENTTMQQADFITR
jgi:hypothetical protein